MGAKPWSQADKQFLRNNHHKSIAYLAEKLGRTSDSIHSMLARMELLRGRPRLEDYRESFIAAHALGLSDRRIAGRLSIPRTTATSWRNQLGLPPNGWSKETRKLQSKRLVKRNKKRKKKPERKPLPEKPWKIQSMATYSDEQGDWIAVILKFRDEHKRPPTLQEAFRLALSVGYRKESQT